jgi:hypothetical protein
MKNANETLASLKRNSIGPMDKNSKKDQQAEGEAPEADKIKSDQTKEVLKTAKKQYIEAIAANY